MKSSNLREAIKKAGLSQAKLAEVMHVSPNTVWRWCAGVNDPDDDTKRSLAEVLGTSIAYLMGETHELPVNEGQEVGGNIEIQSFRYGRVSSQQPPSLDTFAKAREAARNAGELETEDLQAAILMLRAALRELEKAKDKKSNEASLASAHKSNDK